MRANIQKEYTPENLHPRGGPIDLHEAQQAVDAKRLVHLALDLLIETHPHTGERKIAERYYAPSRKTKDPQNENWTHGPWITKKQAIEEVSTSAEYLKLQAELERNHVPQFGHLALVHSGTPEQAHVFDEQPVALVAS